MYLLHLVSIALTARFVTAYEECEGELCPQSVVSVPRKLTFGNNIGPLVGRDPVTGCYCRERVDLFSLCYGRSHCTAMTQNLPINTNALKLTNTHIRRLRPGDFQKLSHLIELQIEGNYELERIMNGTFRNLHNLANLSIAFNSKLKIIERGAFVGLSNLRQLFLNNNALENLYDITSGLGPKVVPRLITLVLDSNSFFQIGAEDFKSMTNSTLNELSLNFCRIEYIHPKAMMCLKNLQKLNIGQNSISSNVLADALMANIATAQVDLTSLNVFSMGFKKTPPKAMMDVIAKSNITQLNLSKNQFEVINKDSFPAMSKLKLLDLRDVLAIQITDDAFADLPNLNTLLLSGNRLSQISKGVLTLQNLTFLDMQENSEANHVYFHFKDVEFKNMTNLRYLNLGYNGLSHLFDTSFRDLKNLRVLILKNCSIFHIERRTFVLLEKLKVLNLANNLLVHEYSVPDVFFALTKLEVLVLSGCKFKYISKRNNPFRNLVSLRRLTLDRNLLTTIDATDFLPLVSLQMIDLSHNLLNSWEQRIFIENQHLNRLILSKNKLADLTVAMLEDFAGVTSIDLDQNAILCKCMGTYKSYKIWQRIGSNDNIFVNGSIFDPPIFCGYPDNLDNVTVIDFLTKQQYGEQICSFRSERIYLFLPLICTVLVFVCLGILAFWYRWHIKYWIFLSKLYLSRRGKLKHNQQQKKCYNNYEYDAFVSYSTEDRDFVVKLIKMMEHHEPFLKLCVYERDFQIGTIISESVLESVAKSRKTVLVISDNYAKSQWCRWESQICEHHRLFFENEDGEYVDDSLVLIKLSPVSESYLTPTLKYLLKTRIYLQWGWDERKQELFWSRLRTTLGPPISLSEITHM